MNNTMRLIQLQHTKEGRRIAWVDDDQLVLLSSEYRTAYQLVTFVIEAQLKMGDFIKSLLSSEVLQYDQIYEGKGDWKILPSFDHPEQPSMCMLSGTGLTHKASAQDRQKMHSDINDGAETDSMKIYQMGEMGGKPKEGRIGVQPEWFYKGNGTMLRAHNEDLWIPPYGLDGGEEPEIAGVYLIDQKGIPVRIGFVTANEFSDHVMEKKNYLYLAPSKLRNSSIGPELVLENDFTSISGRVWIKRDGKEIWSKRISTGEDNITHSLENLEYHHFKYDQHRIPGSVHIHFFGADGLSYGDGLKLKDGDQMGIEWEGFGRPLINTLRDDASEEILVNVKSIYP